MEQSEIMILFSPIFNKKVRIEINDHGMFSFELMGFCPRMQRDIIYFNCDHCAYHCNVRIDFPNKIVD